jgi:predicted nucleotidyltransferase
VAAYLFGSRARGDASAASDVDVAIWLEKKPSTFEEHRFGLGGELERDLGVPVDVVILNGAPSDLVHRVLRDGILLVERDRSARIRFEVRARNDYFDMMPIRDRYRRGGARKGA